MAVSKVILNGTTLMDTTDKTVTAANLLNGYTALKNDGTTVTGEYVPSGATLQSKTVSPSTSQQTVSPDSGYDGLSSVTVNAMPSGSATTPATTITANPTISVSASGLITASVSKTQGVTPTVSAGYVASGTSGTITVNGSNTNQLTTKSAQTYTPTTSDQTIASGQYLIGTQTVKGDANLLAENIKKDVVLFGITGTYEGSGGGGSMDIVIKCTNASGFTNNASDYVFEVGSFDSVIAKLIAGEAISGIAYCKTESWDDEDEIYGANMKTLYFDSANLSSGSRTAEWYGQAVINFKADNIYPKAVVTAPTAKYAMGGSTEYLSLSRNDDPNMPVAFNYTQRTTD